LESWLTFLLTFPTRKYVAITDLEKYGFDVAVTGFEVMELDKMWQQMERKKGNVVEDDFNGDAEAEQIKNPMTQPGDIWHIGRHRLMCGDSTDASAVKKLMDGKKARMCFTEIITQRLIQFKVALVAI